MVKLKALLWLALISLSMYLSSCATQSRCYRLYGQLGDTTYIHDTITATVAASDTGRHFSDSAVVGLAEGDSLAVTTPDGLATATLKRRPRATPGAGAGYDLKASHTEWVKRIPIEVPCPPTPVLKPPEPKVVEVTPVWNWILIGALAALLIYQTLRRHLYLSNLYADLINRK